MMTDWNPALYSHFEDERTRAAAELLACVPLEQPVRIVDLGCGPGNSTELLTECYPEAQVIGIDTSQAMLAAARQRLPGITFERRDIVGWSPDKQVHLTFANAVLQWVPDHQSIFPSLLSTVLPGGVLAVQMPDNFDEPTHALMREIATDPRFAPSIGDSGSARMRLLRAEDYYDLLASAAEVDIWRTTYYHCVDDAADIARWLRGTALKPFLDPLTPELQALFLQEYEQRIDEAYPARVDGTRLLRYPRMFMVARRR